MASVICACTARRCSWSRLLVCHLMSERMLEGVFEIGKEPRLVEELGGLQPVEAAHGAPPPGSPAIAWSSGERHVLADDRGGLEQALVLRRAVGRCGPPGWSGRWKVPGAPGAVASAGTRPRSPTSAFVSTSVRTVSSRKNGLPALDEELLERRERWVVARAAPRAAPSALSAASVSSRIWRVGRLAAPAMLVLGPVVDEQQQTRGAAGCRPSCRAAPASRHRSSGGLRTQRGAVAPGSRAAAGA